MDSSSRCVGLFGFCIHRVSGGAAAGETGKCRSQPRLSCQVQVQAAKGSQSRAGRWAKQCRPFPGQIRETRSQSLAKHGAGAQKTNATFKHESGTPPVTPSRETTTPQYPTRDEPACFPTHNVQTLNATQRDETRDAPRNDETRGQAGCPTVAAVATPRDQTQRYPAFDPARKHETVSQTR